MTVVYWIHTENHNDPTSQGYIGITDNLYQRIQTHLSRPNITVGRAFEKYGYDQMVFTQLFEGTREECYEIEQDLRPTRGLAWNIARGGIRVEQCDIRPRRKAMSQETRDKQSAASLGRPKTLEHRAAMSRGKRDMPTDRKDAWRLKVSIARTGTTRSEASKEKSRIAMSGRKWWNNGSQSVRAFIQPGQDWVAGRISWKK